MDATNPIPVILTIFLAWATAHLLAKRFTVILPIGRISTIDGLRGYLGFAVFLHHASIWFFFLQTGKWMVPPSNLYTHLGQSGVALFFMITGFLFFSKLIESRERPIDWTKLYISRLFRLTPLYLFSMAALFCIVAILSHGQLRVPIESLAFGLIRWLTFTIGGAPDLNGVLQTWTIVAGVTWSLPFEWAFYLMLPIFALMVTSRPPKKYLVIAIFALVFFIWLFRHNLLLLMPFIGGMVASILVRYKEVRVVATSKISTILILACSSAIVVIFPTAYQTVPLVLLSIVFTLIAGGNTLFGLLINHTSRVLGELAYSIYLLHGIVLFLLFRFLIGFSTAAKFSPYEYWALMALCTPVLISLCFFSFRRIELPAMRIAPKFINWLRSRRTFVSQDVLGSRI